MKVVLLDRIDPQGQEMLRQRGLAVEEKLGLKGQDLVEAVSDADGVIIRSSVRIDKAVMEGAQKLKVIGRAGIGLDNVDIPEATRRGIVVMNTPTASTTTTAELSVAMLMALSRNIPQANASVKAGKWDRKSYVGREIQGKQAGVIGLGKIGLAVALRLKRLEMTVVAYDPFVSKETADRYGIRLADLEEVLSTSDYLTLHAPTTDATRNLLNAKSLATVKPGVMIVNCARGALIDEAALLEALEDGRVAGAALDVFQQEPPEAGHPLVAHPHVIVTPHQGASTREAQEKVATEIVEQVADALIDGQFRNAANLPAIDLDSASKAREYVKISTALASLVAQLIQGRPHLLEVEYGGLPEEVPGSMLLNAALEAVLGRQLESGVVNQVNAQIVAKERGLENREIRSNTTAPFSNRVRVTLHSDRETRSLAASVFSHGVPRLVELDGFSMEASLTPFMLISRNLDRPGVIGKLGTLLGAGGVNIAGMQLGRLKEREEAVSVLNVDSPLPEAVLKEIRSMEPILECTFVQVDVE